MSLAELRGLHATLQTITYQLSHHPANTTGEVYMRDAALQSAQQLSDTTAKDIQRLEDPLGFAPTTVEHIVSTGE